MHFKNGVTVESHVQVGIDMELPKESYLVRQSRPEIYKFFKNLLTESDLTVSIGEFVDFLLTVSDHNVRDCLAMSLSECRYDGSEIFDAIVLLLQDEKTLNHRGTLLYALRNFDCTTIFPLLIDFVISGGWEVAHEAHSIISAIEINGGAAIEYAKIIDALESADCLDWRRRLLKDLKQDFTDPLHLEEMIDFWKWFKSNEYVLFDVHGDFCNFYQELDDRFNRFAPCLEWEISPQEEGVMCFVVSPHIQSNLIEQAREVISHRPNFENTKWRFHVGRQRRPWSEIIRIAQNKKLSFSTIDLTKWKYLVFRVPDSELLDIVFSCGENCLLSDDDLDKLATLVAVGLLGEMVVIESVDEIQVVKAFDGDRANSAKPVEWLPYEFGMRPL